MLLLEHHYQFGGLATWFKRAGGHIFDISLHGFPVGMIKSCRRYWTKEIADSIVQLKNIRFVNPQYDLKTTFDRMDFTQILQDSFQVATWKESCKIWVKSIRSKVVFRSYWGFTNLMFFNCTIESAISLVQYRRHDFIIPTGKPCKEISNMWPPARLNQVARPPNW